MCSEYPQCYSYASLSKCVLSWVLKVDREGASRVLRGRAFQRCGAVSEKGLRRERALDTKGVERRHP
ncbi:hypothetical protein FKM82_022089 [Ascaphus truei]